MADLDAVEISRIVDEQCDLFEDAWFGHGEPAIGEFLDAVPDELQGEVFGKLLAIEIELIARSGQWPSAEAYHEEFPQHADRIGTAFAELQEWASKTDAVDELVKSSIIAIDRDTACHTQEDTVVWGPSAGQTVILDSQQHGEPVAGLPNQIGRYRIVKELGKGGMGRVVLAKDTVLDRDLALKLPEFDPADGDEAIERFYREARAMATVHHPHLCQVYDVGEEDGHHYLTMAYIDGQTLEEKIAEQPLKQDEAARLTGALALAIHAAHEAGVVHRDLKPSNVMINRSGEPFITDFGLALRDAVTESEITHSGTLVGSPAYMAPEQVEADNDRIGPHTDVYALGVMLYQLLTGRRPFDGKGLSVLGQISSGVAPPPPSQFADVSQSLESICLKAMAHRIDERFQSAAELATALENREEALAGGPHFFGKRLRTATAGFLCLVLIVAAIAWQQASEQPESLTELSSNPVAVSDTNAIDARNLTAFVADFLATEWSEPERLAGPVNGPMIDGGPSFSSDGLSVLFHRPNARLGTYKLWTATRPSMQSDFGAPRLMPGTLNESGNSGSRHRFNPRLSHDDRTLVFNCGMERKTTGAELWYAYRESAEAAWDEAQPFGPPVNSGTSDMSPFLTDDRLTLIFSSERRGGAGGFDFWMATRISETASFGQPANLGTRLNTEADETHPWLSADGCLLLFRSIRPEGLGGSDLWYSTRVSRDDEFGPAVNFGVPVNSPDNESFGSLSPDGGFLYFESDRPGGSGRFDVWMARRRPVSLESSPAGAVAWLQPSDQQFDPDDSTGVAAGDMDGDGDFDVVVARRNEPSQVLLNDGSGRFHLHQALDSEPCLDVSLADLDGDGDLDAGFVGQGSGVPGEIWLNDGSGTLTASGQAIPGQEPWDIQFADLDGDADLDAVVADRAGPDSVLLNDGNGHLEDTGQTLDHRKSTRLAFGDFDNDGDADLFCGNYSNTSDTVWINDGTGTFTDSGQRLGNSTCHGVAIVDIDRDGDLDAYVSNVVEPDSIWLNDGSGVFTEARGVDERQVSCRVTVADLNDDGFADLFIANGFRGEPERAQILLSTPDEDKFASLRTPAVAATDAALADFDGDGDVDAFVATQDRSRNVVWFNTLTNVDDRSLPTFTLRRIDTSVEPTRNPLMDSGQELGQSSAYAVAAGDIDDDGDVDMLVANFSDSQPDQVWLNDGDGSFSQGQQLESLGGSDVELADLDNDGDLDAVVAWRNAPSVVWLNDGEGRFEKLGDLEDRDAKTLAVGDVDGDGDKDVLIGGRTPDNRVLLNDGSALFIDSGQRLMSPSESLGMGLADLDSDGDLDAFVSNWGGGNQVWLNDGNGHFTDSGQRLSGLGVIHVALGDLDNDGDIDAVAASLSEPTRAWINNGSAEFESVVLSMAKGPALSVAIADITGDGRNDVLLGNGELSDGYAMFPNQLLVSTGHLTWESHWFGAEATAGFGIADLDGDGTLDAFLANGFGHADHVWMNRKPEEQSAPVYFRDSGQRLGRSTSNSADSGDVDGDGDLDVVVANLDGDPSVVWINDGEGSFSEGMRFNEPMHAYDAEFGDVDGDGDLDVFLTDRSGPDRVWQNDGTGHFTVTEQQIGNSNSNQVALNDFDGDGDLDAWVGNFNPDHDRLWLNDGSGRFEDSGQELGAGRNYSVTTADVDNDGDIDVIVGTGPSHANILWLNDGKGRFTRSDQNLNENLASNGFMVGDLNGDGFPDLYECAWQRPDAVWLNDGQGRFAIAQTGQKMRSRRAGLADFDGDGDLDVFVTNEGNLPNAVCLNDGQGKLSFPVQFPGNSTTSDVALGDFDGDGNIDAFTANHGSTPNRVWLNKPGTERHASQSVPDFPPGSAAAIFTSNDYLWTQPVHLSLGGADQAFISPFLSAGGRDLYMVHVAPDRSLDIVVSTRETTEEPWRFPIPLSGPINTSSKNGSPTVSNDGKVIIFGSNRPGGHGSYDLWMAERESKDVPFGEPVNIGPTINSSSDDGAARLSADGLTLLFHSSRPGGHGGYDLWQCTRKAVDEPFGPPANLGPEVNTEADERDPATSEDGTLLIYRYAKRELRMRTRRSISDPYGPPQSLPYLAGDESAETPCISGDTVHFVSERGGEGKRRIWMMRRLPKAKREIR